LGSISWERVQAGLFHRQRWVRALTVLALCLAVSVPIGAVIGLLGAIYGTALLLALAVAYTMLRVPLAGLVVLVAVICLLPFAALPIDIGFSPTILDVVLIGLYFVWLCRLALHKDDEFRALPPTGAVLAFIALSVVSFIAGLSHAQLTPNVIRHFGEILMSVALFVLVINMVRNEAQLRTIVLALIIAGAVAALVGVVLCLLPETLTVRLLSMLRVVRYPSGQAVLRYVEDNPELPLRATSTSVDPNVLGGLLIFVGTLTAAQVVAKRPILKRGWLIGALAIIVLCLLLTYSRGSFLGFAAALFMLAVLRYPRLLLFGVLALALILILPFSRYYVEHMLEAFLAADLATQMRLGEYKDALVLIGRYPWFGVGFAGSPDIDTYIGVSSVYLLIGEEMGLVGLAAFLAAAGSFLASFFKSQRTVQRDSSLEPLMLGTCLAVLGALVGGIVDHYLFNLDFPHAAALLWLTMGLGAVSIRLAATPQKEQARTAAL
jgi:O-antigen ligase